MVYIYILNMNKSQLKSIIKSVIKESLSENDNEKNLDITPFKSDLDALKRLSVSLHKKIESSLVGKPMTGEKVAGGDPYRSGARRTKVDTKIKHVEVVIEWSSKRNQLYLSVYAMADNVDAGEQLFSDYV